MRQPLFYAGAASVLAARWPIPYETADAVFAGTFQRAFSGGASLGAALVESISEAMSRADILQLMNDESSAPFFWGPFALFGSGV